jgi:hypothetical protein
VWGDDVPSSVLSRACLLCDRSAVCPRQPSESQAALETFRSSGPDTEQRLAMLTVSVQEYDIVDVRPVFGGCGMNRPDGLCCDR